MTLAASRHRAIRIVRAKKIKPNDKKAGGQHGHLGMTLKKVERRDEIEVIYVDQRTLPPGRHHRVGFESRQVIDIKIFTVVTDDCMDARGRAVQGAIAECQAEILEDQNGPHHRRQQPRRIAALECGRNRR